MSEHGVYAVGRRLDRGAGEDRRHGRQRRRRQRQDVLDEATLLADVRAEVKKAIAAGRDCEGIRTLEFPPYATLRKYNRREISSRRYATFTTGKPLLPYGAGQ
jgi:hypothetical protein